MSPSSPCSSMIPPDFAGALARVKAATRRRPYLRMAVSGSRTASARKRELAAPIAAAARPETRGNLAQRRANRVATMPSSDEPTSTVVTKPYQYMAGPSFGRGAAQPKSMRLVPRVISERTASFRHFACDINDGRSERKRL